MATECKHGQLARSCPLCELEAENERLRAELAEIAETYRRIMDEPCGDEQHCTCVPVLRTENERLRTALREIIRLPPFGSSSIAGIMQDIAKAALDAAGGK